jgi:hypothetical protein
MKKLIFYSLCIFLSTFVFLVPAEGNSAKNTAYFELKVFHFSNSQQESGIDSFVQNDLIPYLHKSGIKNIGVFKAIANDTAVDKKMFIFIPFNSLKQWEKYLINSKTNDPAININSEYANATNDKPYFSRMETIFLQAFKFMPELAASKLSSPKNDRVYELRSYESGTNKLYRNKVQMINEGGEIDLFNRLGFNAVFYAEVIHGTKMPNLMYMTSFENKNARDEHWAAFSKDPAWKTLSAKKEYQKNVSKIEITFLRPTEYSEL